MDEIDPPVAARQAVQDGGVVHKHTMHGLAEAQGVMQCSMIKGAQIAPEPDQGSLDCHYLLCLGSKKGLFSPQTVFYGRSRRAFGVAAMAIQCKLADSFAAFCAR